MITVGVLALQGAFIEHVHRIESLGHTAVEVRTADQLESIDGLILPGGESTAMGKLLVDFDIKAPLTEKIRSGLPVWGTCAGMILLAEALDDDPTVHLGVMDIRVRRNAYGRQLDSFVTHEIIEPVSADPVPLVFIRAPFIVGMKETVDPLLVLDGHAVAVRQSNMLATSFHPELTDNTAFLEYFIKMIPERE